MGRHLATRLQLDASACTRRSLLLAQVFLVRRLADVLVFRQLCARLPETPIARLGAQFLEESGVTF